jgi:hypothetical protein
LRLALKIACTGKLCVAFALGPGLLDILDQFADRVHRHITSMKESCLDRFRSALQFLLREMMTGLACTIDIQEGTAHVMIADLGAALALVWHVAIRASDSSTRVHSLVEHFELGVLRQKQCPDSPLVPASDFA